jgi:hypothetical protein
LAASRAILKRFRRRDLYKFVDEVLVPPDADKGEIAQRLIELQALQIVASDTSHQLQESDIIIDHTVMNYAMKNKNPVNHVKFFSKWDDTGMGERIEKSQQ